MRIKLKTKKIKEILENIMKSNNVWYIVAVIAFLIIVIITLICEKVEMIIAIQLATASVHL